MPTRCRFRVTRVRGGLRDTSEKLSLQSVYAASSNEANCCKAAAAAAADGNGTDDGNGNGEFSSVNAGRQQQCDDNKCRDGEIPMYCAAPSVAMDLAETSHIDKTVHSSHSLYIECPVENTDWHVAMSPCRQADMACNELVTR